MLSREGDHEKGVVARFLLLSTAFLVEVRKRLRMARRQRKGRRIFRKMQVLHASEIKRIQRAGRARVVYLVIHESVWKVDEVFKKMLADPFFDPLILVCPDVKNAGEDSLSRMRSLRYLFEEKGYPVISSYDDVAGRWMSLSEVCPDVVFFTNPHNLTMPEYYDKAYRRYLSCYVPYFYLVTSHGDDQSIYNQDFHNAMWRIFMPHELSCSAARKVSACAAENCELTGYPACEPLLEKVEEGAGTSWKMLSRPLKRIIIAPHHTISDGELVLSNFLELADFFVDMVVRYEGAVQWSFKPHPLLKPKLYLHPDWGCEATDKYYDFWRNHANAQLDEGDYYRLFVESDAIIHDSGSFIVEYLFVEKPAMYLSLPGSGGFEGLNDFALKALRGYRIARNKRDILSFVDAVVAGTAGMAPDHSRFIEEEILPNYTGSTPSDRIVSYLKTRLQKVV